MFSREHFGKSGKSGKILFITNDRENTGNIWEIVEHTGETAGKFCQEMHDRVTRETVNGF